MSAPAFTPGPWSIVSERDDELKVKGSGDEWVADCADGFWSDEADGWVMAEEGVPNARLIAAAPELFELLTDIDDMWSDDGDGGRADPIDARSGKVREIWTGIRAALAKARGEA